MRTRHNPRDYTAGRRISCSSGFICGNPVPLRVVEYVPVAKIDEERKERYRQGAIKAWQKRRGHD